MAKHLYDLNLADIAPDNRNANKGTERGAGMLEHSLRTYGAGRSILLDKNNRVIAGNKTLEQASQIGLDVLVVDSDGTKLIAVRRTDVNLDSVAGRELAIADNRTSEVGLSWDVEALKELERDGVTLNAFWFDSELDALLKTVEVAPDDFKEYDEQIETKTCCPSCGYQW